MSNNSFKSSKQEDSNIFEEKQDMEQRGSEMAGSTRVTRQSGTFSNTSSTSKNNETQQVVIACIMSSAIVTENGLPNPPQTLNDKKRIIQKAKASQKSIQVIDFPKASVSTLNRALQTGCNILHFR